MEKRENNIDVFKGMAIITSTRSVASVSCEKSNNKIYDVELFNTGILKLMSKCKCYTYSTILFTTSNETEIFHNNYIPTVNINSDDCCIRHQEFLKSEETQMDPVVLTKMNLDDLRHSQHKLEQFDEILQQNINKPFVVRHFSWFTCLTALISICIFLCCCCKCGFLPYIGKFWPKGKSCCGFPSVCITNHNERLEISEEQMLRLNRLRRLCDSDENVRDLVSISDSRPRNASKRLIRSIEGSPTSSEHKFQI